MIKLLKTLPAVLAAASLASELFLTVVPETGNGGIKRLLKAAFGILMSLLVLKKLCG